jgi:hypothetical protein
MAAVSQSGARQWHGFLSSVWAGSEIEEAEAVTTLFSLITSWFGKKGASQAWN